MAGPLGLPWATFAALLVVIASVALAVIWSVVTGRRDDSKGGRDE